MGRYRKILVAVDGSETALHALRETFRLSRGEKSWVVAVSVVPGYEGDLELVGTGNLMATMRRPSEVALEKARTMADQEKILLRTILEEGRVDEVIADTAEAENCDLIVMGRGHREGRRFSVASLTARVVGLSRVDVLIVPESSALGFSRILVATDGSRFSQTASERAVDLAASYGSEQLTALSVANLPAEFYAESPQTVEMILERCRKQVDHIKTTADGRGVPVDPLVTETEDAATGILEASVHHRAELIVMGSHGRTGLRRLLMGSVAEKVVARAGCPILVVKS